MDALAKKAMAHIPKGSPFGPFYDASLQGLTEAMKKNGVDYSLTLHIASKPQNVQKVNDWAIFCQSQKNIFAFGSLHPNLPLDQCRAEIIRLKQNKIAGLKFHPHHQAFDVDDKAMYPIYQLCAKHDMIMLFHAGTDLRIIGDYCSPRRFNKFVSDFYGAKIVGAHLGGMLDWDNAFDLLLGKDIYLDTSFAYRYLYPDQKKRLFDGHDHKKILFGTDGPYVCAKNDIEILKNDINNKNILNDILYQNAANLLNLS